MKQYIIAIVLGLFCHLSLQAQVFKYYADINLDNNVDEKDIECLVDMILHDIPPQEINPQINLTNMRFSPDANLIGTSPIGIQISPQSLVLSLGKKSKLSYTVIYEDNPLYVDKTAILISSDPSVASVSADGTITGLKLGNATITAVANRNHTIWTTCQVTVSVIAESITLDQTQLILDPGKSSTLQATLAPADVTDNSITWSSSNEEVAQVNESGKVTAIRGGTAIVTATSNSNPALTAQCEVLVSSFELDKTEHELAEGQNVTLKATFFPDAYPDKTVTWRSGNTAVATVDAAGKVTAVGPGRTTITATSNRNPALVAQCEILVCEITINNTIGDMLIGQNNTLMTTFIPDSYPDKTLVWSSGDKSVATVDATGKVTAVGAGRTIITATSKRNPAFFAQCEIIVCDITIDKAEWDMGIGQNVTLTATIKPDSYPDKAVRWSSGNTAVATVDANGKVTAISPGRTTITATSVSNPALVAQCVITVCEITIDKTEYEMLNGQYVTLTATVLPNILQDKSVTWSSSDTSVATVDAAGKVTAVGAGVATIYATLNNKPEFFAKCEIMVPNISLGKTIYELGKGQVETLTATITPDTYPDKAVRWSSGNTSVATVDANGKVTAISPGRTTITATSVSNPALVAQCEILVCEITIDKTEYEMVKGQNVTLTATVKPDALPDRSVTWSSSDTSLATVDATGKVTAVGAGTVTITATSNYNSRVVASCIITIKKSGSGSMEDTIGTGEDFTWGN